MIREMEFAGTKMLQCDECPSKPEYGDPPQMDWNKSCVHIEEFIADFGDSGGPGGGTGKYHLMPSTKYQLNLSPMASWLCRDMWTSWFTFETSISRDPQGYSMEVIFEYESDFFNNSSGSLGIIMPEDGRQSVRNVLWDWATNELLLRQPTADQGGLVCPQRTHTSAEQKEFVKDLQGQVSLNAQIACIVFENCCCYCYRKTMGNDANFGFDGAQQSQAPRQSTAGSPQPATQTSNSQGSQNTISKPASTFAQGGSIPSGSPNSNKTSSTSISRVVNVPNPNFAPPPWQTGGNSAKA